MDIYLYINLYFNINVQYPILLLNSALLIKLGAAPFHFWFPEVMNLAKNRPYSSTFLQHQNKNIYILFF